MIRNIATTFVLCIGLISAPLYARTLLVGVNPEYPPFEYKDKRGELAGFDIDLMTNICSHLNRECDYIELPFDELIPKLVENQFDLIISAIDVTEKRKKEVLFSDPYYLNYSIYITTRDQKDWIDGIGFSKLGVLAGSTHQQYLYSQFVGTRINIYREYPEAIQDLLDKKIALVFGDGEVVYDYTKKNNDLVVYGDKVTDEEYFGSGLAIAVKLGNQKLIDDINQSLEALKESGKYDEIYNKWFQK